ncbi:putative inner centromere protein [Diplodia seriata]|uniref:Putative inner centromere protein n=1 Tax=Diplodia seriata TaxID=420778 RepID=A0A0G2EAF2_9PEZI|nr:putative inner centromere protein [Diplodia seriata]
MAASRNKAPVGSAPWILGERQQAAQFVEQEVEEFSFSVRNEMEWLNEHMAEIFNRPELNIADTFKTPGKLRGKTPRTIRKRNPLETRAPLTDIFAPNPANAPSPTRETSFYKQIEQIQIAEDPEDADIQSVEDADETASAIPPGDSGYHGMSEDDMDVDEDESVARLSPRKESPAKSIQSSSPKPQDPPRKSASASFLSAKEDLDHQAPSHIGIHEDEDGSDADNEITIHEDEMDLVPTQPDESPIPQENGPPRSPQFSVGDQTASALNSVLNGAEDNQDPHDEQEQEQEQEDDGARTPSDGSSPAKPLLRKSSLTFSSLPAREPLAGKKSMGSRISRTSHVDQYKARSSHFGRFTGGKSLGGGQTIATADDDNEEDDDDDDWIAPVTSKPLPLPAHLKKSGSVDIMENVSGKTSIGGLDVEKAREEEEDEEEVEDEQKAVEQERCQEKTGKDVAATRLGAASRAETVSSRDDDYTSADDAPKHGPSRPQRGPPKMREPKSRLLKPTASKESLSKPRHIKVGLGSQRSHPTNADLSKSLHGTLPNVAKTPAAKNTADATNSSFAKTSGPAGAPVAKPTSLALAAKNKEREEREAQRKAEKKRAIEQQRAERAAKAEEDRRKADEDRRAEAQRKAAEQQRAQEAKRAASRQALAAEAKKQEQLRAQAASKQTKDLQLNAKRRKTLSDDEEEEPTDARRSMMAPPIRQSNVRKLYPERERLMSVIDKAKEPNKFAHGYKPATAAGPSSHAQSMFKQTVKTQHQLQHNKHGGHPNDMATISKAKIPFADASGPSAAAGPSSSVFKTPARTTTVPLASPHFPTPELPEIATDSEDEDSDSEAANFQAPSWVNSPALRELLTQQQLVDPMEVFGPIAPLQMEEIFKNKDRHKRFRERTSSAYWAKDKLTEEERKKDMEGREKLMRDGGWTYGNSGS